MIVLASASPRRRELLPLLIGDFAVIPSQTDERTDIEDARELVRFLAREKARDVAKARPGDTVIGADTVVELYGAVLGKPRDTADARRMITLLSGNTHTVLTGLCVIGNEKEFLRVCETKVTFAPLSGEEIEAYLSAEDVLDKAGAYAIQAGAARFITGIEGDFFNVVGLPVRALYEMLREAGAKEAI